MVNFRLYRFWGNLTEGLRTGLPQNEVKEGKNFFEELYSDPRRLKEFLSSITTVRLTESPFGLSA